jgi:hypothetical protein
MNSVLDEPRAERSVTIRRLEAAAEIALIFGVFFIQAGWAVPEVNETHYLAKAKHYWDPQWCPRDFFLGTADAHQMFYWTCGWLTRCLSLPALAWLGRSVTWGLLAWAWRRLSFAVVPVPLYSVLSATLFVAAVSQMHMAGEWIVGGFEAKGFAYVLVLLGFEAIVRNRWRFVWPLLGAASAFHVVIGAWSVIAAGFAWLTAGRERPSLRATIAPLLAGLVLSLPGLVPALQLTRASDPALVREANRIYVFERLPHHLVPQTFPPDFVERHLLLWLLWLVLCFVTRSNPLVRRLNFLVAAAVGIALAGFLISFAMQYNDALAAGVLRYYWFRMADIVVPLGMAVLATSYIVEMRRRAPVLGALCLAVAIFAGGWPLVDVISQRRRDPRPPADRKLADLESWREICAWVGENTPPDALFIVPRTSQSFRWYSGRAEVVNNKDIPQDAAGIVEWWRRMNDVYRPRNPNASVAVRRKPATPSKVQRTLNDDGSERLKRLAEKYGADYVITEAQPPLALELVSPPNRSYAVYRFPRNP